MINTAVAFIVYKRPDTTRKVFEAIRQARPPRLYLIADGPKTPDLDSKCREVRQIVENGIDWYCELRPVYSDINLGLAKRVQTGLNHVFSHEKEAIILEDDTLPDISFFNFCEELLLKYESEKKISHISGCNFHSEIFSSHHPYSYFFSSIINIWGWATWRRCWQTFDLSMDSWNNENKNEFLDNWCINSEQKKGMKQMFDLHCQNNDPWTWDYQWIYSCWKTNGLSITPIKNLVSNIGIGPNATHTVSEKLVPRFPKKIENISFPLRHSPITRDLILEKKYINKSRTPFSIKIKLRVREFLKRYFLV